MSKAPRATKVSKVPKVPKDKLEQPGNRVLKVLKVRKETRERKAKKVTRGQKVLRVPQEQMEKLLWLEKTSFVRKTSIQCQFKVVLSQLLRVGYIMHCRTFQLERAEKVV